jgi:hypothetical protein
VPPARQDVDRSGQASVGDTAPGAALDDGMATQRRQQSLDAIMEIGFARKCGAESLAGKGAAVPANFGQLGPQQIQAIGRGPAGRQLAAGIGVKQEQQSKQPLDRAIKQLLDLGRPMTFPSWEGCPKPASQLRESRLYDTISPRCAECVVDPDGWPDGSERFSRH